MRYFKYIVISGFLFLFSIYSSQGQSTLDTLQRAKQLRDSGQLGLSCTLLGKYYKSHPKDLNTLWLFANISYLNKDYKTSVRIYREAVLLFPDNYLLQLDYGKILTSLGKLDEAVPIIKNYLKHDDANKEAGLYLATIYYWQLKYREASEVLSGLLKKDPSNVAARQLLDRIHEDKSPVLQAGIELNTDDQPMQTLTPWAKVNLYTPKLHELQMKLSTSIFTDDTVNTTAYMLSAGNKFILGKSGLGLYLEAGIFNNPEINKSIFTANLRLEKTLFGKIRLSAGMERKPYYLTLGSAQNPLAENRFYFSAGLGKEEKWNLKAGIENSSFPSDSNNILTAYSWLITPALKTGKFSFRLGYGMNYSDAKQSRFVAKKTIDQMIADSSYKSIEGVYSPYFTPKNTIINSVLGIVSIKPVKNLSINVKMSYGFYAVTQNPYLFLKEKGSNGNGNGNGNDTIMIATQFTSMNFNPYEFNADLTYQLGRSFSVSADFKSFKTLYYRSQFIGIRFKKVF